ncbi:protein REVERSION-TO-ETHYLENE SENSITIVITY1 [Amborella trichopoda]|uniref:Uncharacterized protein n=1 Tax=Amborella trichopoda TaxID=13333 RepID=U5D4V6_AMBTC|nr:protein REVERSION-TO-ETHYLENE SENSITIVITY1 [Amborella trichopoda]XP_020529572.1 protein REVERSION-TO-ETHYLENE SENSITIVITY1 [Amborella trichopoda]XP_020529573.1 protein REVERSION-TO-ETHYLENE SENSITIVITY1 [Amborella trichopoda]ERN16452.1 hypothetical protein AMTR_s00052p00198680 [Amborella trichopoda]|eukprot:XP_006854985.1 protein REVERSION-TO-ETHYLENE SENSITIVITY1 [Amborella trichopoda]
MEVKAADDIEDAHSKSMLLERWPLAPVDLKRARFPCCIVWTPLPIVSWLAPFMGHLGICREDGTILDFSGSNFVSVDNFTFGAVARYIQLDRDQCCFPPHLSGHTCKNRYKHLERGTAISWDDALRSSTQHFQHHSYNLLTCNSHSFVANCLNRLAYSGSVSWNPLNIGALVLLRARWVDPTSVLRSFFPFAVVLALGIFMVGPPFLLGLASFSLLLFIWFVFGTYCVKNLVEW